MSRQLAFALAAAAACLVYANSIPNGFAYDDAAILLKNERVHGLDRWTEIWTEPYWPGAEGERPGLYRPVTSLSFALDWAVWDGRPQGFHLTNVALHAAATCLLLALLLQGFGVWPALAGACLFAVHPVHTEAVANIVGRAEVLAAAFAFAALACLGLPATAPGAPPARPVRAARRAAAAAALFALGILSKEGAIVLPGLLLALDAARGGLAGGVRAYVRARAPAYLVLLGAAAAVLAVRVAVLGDAAAAEPADAFALDASFRTRLFTMIRVWPEYVRLLLVPLDLSADYSPAVILPARTPTLAGALGVALALAALALAWAARHRAPWVSAGIVWVPIALLPVSNLFFVTGVVLAERTLYLPSAGLAFIAAALWQRLAPLPRASAWAAAYAAALAGFAVLTVARNPDWRSSAAIFNDLRRNHPESYRAHWVLASDLVRRGDPSAATRWYETAYAIWPNEYGLAVDFAGHLSRTGQPGRAADVAMQAVRLRPERAAGWELRIAALFRARRFADAAAWVEQAPAAVRDRPAFAYVVAAALEELGRPAAAADWRALASAPEPSGGVWVPLYEVARLQVERGDSALARKTLREAWRAAAGDSAGMRFVSRLSSEVDLAR